MIKCQRCYVNNATTTMPLSSKPCCKDCKSDELEALNQDANREMGIPESLLDEDWGGK